MGIVNFKTINFGVNFITMYYFDLRFALDLLSILNQTKWFQNFLPTRFKLYVLSN